VHAVKKVDVRLVRHGQALVDAGDENHQHGEEHAVNETKHVQGKVQVHSRFVQGSRIGVVNAN